MKTRFNSSTLLALFGPALMIHVAVAQNVTVDYLGSDGNSDWKTNLVLNTAAPGSIDFMPTGSRGPGVAVNADVALPGGGGGDFDYSVGGTFNLSANHSFSHGFFQGTGVAPDGSINDGGFGIKFTNSGSVNQDTVALLVNGSEINLSGLAFNFDVIAPLSSTAFLEYDFSFIQVSRQTWMVSGDVRNDKGASILAIRNGGFSMNTFEAQGFGLQVDDLGLVADASPPVSQINGLQWRANAVPEPSGVLLLSVSAFGVLLRRKR